MPGIWNGRVCAQVESVASGRTPGRIESPRWILLLATEEQARDPVESRKILDSVEEHHLKVGQSDHHNLFPWRTALYRPDSGLYRYAQMEY